MDGNWQLIQMPNLKASQEMEVKNVKKKLSVQRRKTHIATHQSVKWMENENESETMT